MCGIAGFTGNGSKQNLKEMIKSISYRGPDNQTSFYEINIGLAHARLSIVDVSEEGNQPMFTPERDYGITFNGEIYNHLELKEKYLKKEQINFKSTSDTEVILHLYKKYGTKMLSFLNGMFVICIYDFTKKELFIARDRMGQKPLYYSEQKDSFVFGSELKSVLAHIEVEKKLNLEALNQYLTFDYVPTPNSIIEGVFKLEPATFLVIKENKIIKKENYWKHNFNEQKIDFKTAKKQFEELFSKSVKRRLMSDVPLGVFLSGGLDSSAVAYYAQLNSKEKIKTYSVGFEDKSYDEADYAKKVANHINSDHHTEILTEDITLELINEIYPNVDEPFADASLIPTYFLSKFTKENVTVALGGDGSDELLAGYPTFISDNFKGFFIVFPFISKWMYKLVKLLLNSSDKNISFDFKIKQFLRGFTSKKNHVHQLWLGGFLPTEKEKLFKPEVYKKIKNKNGLDLVDSIFKKSKSEKEKNRTINYYYKTYLNDDINVKVDRASMYNSLEVRAPFLDYELVEFINSLPYKYKQKGLFKVKYILKKVMEDKIPNDIIYRPKKGFGIPVSSWLRNELRPLLDEYFSKNNVERVGLFNYQYIEKLLKEHQSRKFNHRKLIWNLLMFMMWEKKNL